MWSAYLGEPLRLALAAELRSDRLQGRIFRLAGEARSLALEPHQPARALGELKVAEPGVGDRVELTDLRVEELSEQEAFDLAGAPESW